MKFIIFTNFLFDHLSKFFINQKKNDPFFLSEKKFLMYRNLYSQIHIHMIVIIAFHSHFTHTISLSTNTQTHNPNLNSEMVIFKYTFLMIDLIIFNFFCSSPFVNNELDYI